MMKAELWRFSRRQLANVISVSGDEKFTAMIVMLKFIETYMQSKFSSMDEKIDHVLRILHGTDGGLHGVGRAAGEETSPSSSMKGEGVEGRSRGGALPSHIVVTIVSVENMPKMDLFGKCDPYVILTSQCPSMFTV
jgi:hypothetical protein